MSWDPKEYNNEIYLHVSLRKIFRFSETPKRIQYCRGKCFRDPERTRLAVDTEGWLHTGDIGEWQLNGTLKIIDRQAIIV